MIQTPQHETAVRHAHRRQAVRRHAQHHHWHFYKNRSDWTFIQNLAGAPIKWSRERLVIGAVIAVVAVLGFGVLPTFAAIVKPASVAAAPLAVETVVLPKTAPVAATPATVADEADWTVVRVERGQTLGALFAARGINAAVMHEFLESNSKAAGLTRLRPGDEIAFQIPSGGTLSALRFDADESNRIVLRRADGKITEEVVVRPIERRVRVAGGTIESSLFGAGEAAGMSDQMILQMAEVFGYDIDFAQDIQRGDSFQVVYEELYRDGERLRGGGIVAARFINDGKPFEAFRFLRDDGTPGFFDGTGRSLRKAFLRTPVEFTRISSRFTSARKHPVLGLTRAHRGVDYAAPRGTPIRAAGAGKVSYRGWKSGYGNVVIVDHANKVQTLYGHMSAFGKIRVGQKVGQGDTIGYVGMTGLASGPHLHYEFRVAGVHRDPLSIELPKAEPLIASELARFRAMVTPMLAQLDLLGQRSRMIAAN